MYTSRHQYSLLGVIFVLLALAPWLIQGSYPQFVLCTAVINAMAVLGLNFIFGLTGQLHLGMAGFMAIAAYTVGLLTTKAQFTFWQSIPPAVLITGLSSLFLGIPTLRLKRYYLAIMTIGFSEVVRYVLQNWMSFTGGVWGVTGIPRPAWGSQLLFDNLLFFYLTLGVLAALAILASIIESSKYGRAFKAVHDDELAVEAMGVNSTQVKVLAFFLCAAYAGIGGGFFAAFHGYISPEIFTTTYSFTFICMLVVGGLGTIPGSILGAVLLTLLMEALRFLGEWYLVVYAALLIVIIVYSPRGLMGLMDRVLLKRHPDKPPVGA